MRALLSVSDKRGIVEFAQALAKLGWEIVSTGGTAEALRRAGIAVIPIDDVTGFPEIMDGRVKTLHPKVHGGLLARRAHPGDRASLKQHGITPIDLVAVNLYPFRETVAKPQTTFEQAIEQIDIGGPSMLRSAAKNHQDVIVVVDPDDYPVGHRGRCKPRASSPGIIPTCARLATKVFAHTAAYDAAILNYLTRDADGAATGVGAGADAAAEPALRGEPQPARGTVRGRRARRSRPAPAPRQGAVVQQPARPGRRADGGRLVDRPPGVRHHQAHHALRDRARAGAPRTPTSARSPPTGRRRSGR